MDGAHATDPAADPLGSLLPSLRTPPPGPASRALADRLRAVESRNVTYVSERWPVFWDEARGTNVRDADGNVYLDLTGAFGVALLGHAHPAVVQAIVGQCARLVHGMGDIHPPTVKVDLLERLAAVSPWGGARTVLASSGAEAVEAALKTAQLASGRPGVLAFEGAYHGLTLGSLAATDREHFRGPFERRMYGGVAFAPFPHPLRDGGDAGPRALAGVRQLLDAGAPNGDEIGSIIVEPVQGRAGVRVPPPGFMAELSELARGRGMVVIADEIFSGTGRCGAMFASSRVGLEPDVVCLGKALGGGMPLSACLGRPEVMDAWPESTGEAVHTSTFLGHPVACAAAIAVLDTLRREAVSERVAELGDQIVALLRARLGDLAAVREVRGLGLLIGIELGGGPDARPGAAGRVAETLLAEGILTLPAGALGDVLELSPSVELGDDQIVHAVDAIARAVEGAP